MTYAIGEPVTATTIRGTTVEAIIASGPIHEHDGSVCYYLKTDKRPHVFMGMFRECQITKKETMSK